MVGERVRRNRDALVAALTGTAADVLPAEGGWSAIVRVPAVRSDEAWALHLLANHGVLVQPGYFFDFDETVPGVYLVLSLLAPPGDLHAAAAALRAAVSAC